MLRRNVLGYGGLALGGALTLLLGSQAIAAPAPQKQDPPTECEASALPVPKPNQYSPMLAGDPTGRIQVGLNHRSEDDFLDPYVLMWTDGKPETLDVPQRTEFVAVNSDGHAVGFVRVDGNDWRPLVYRDGAASYLPGARLGSATSVNAGGDIGGYLLADGTSRVPVVWRSGADQPERLPTADGEPAMVHLIADDGTAIGTNLDYEPRRIYAWTPDGKTHQLEPPPNGFIGVEAIADNRLVAGAQVPDSNDNELYEWDLRDLTAAPAKVETEIDWATDVNSKGWIVGESGVWTEPRSVLFHSPEGGDLELPPLGAADETSEEVVALNEDGSILAGTSNDNNGNPRAVLWHCTSGSGSGPTSDGQHADEVQRQARPAQ